MVEESLHRHLVALTGRQAWLPKAAPTALFEAPVTRSIESVNCLAKQRNRRVMIIFHSTPPLLVQSKKPIIAS